MKKFDNIAGGVTLSLGPTDRLDDVPESHRDLVTLELRRAFDDPVACFRQMSEQTDIPTFAEWLKLSIRDEDWRLFLLTWVFEMLLKGETPEFDYGDDPASLLGFSNDDSRSSSDTTRFQVSDEACDRLDKPLDDTLRDLPRLRIFFDDPSVFDEQEKDDEGEN